MYGHEMEGEISEVGLENEDIQDPRHVSSDKNIWRCPSWEPSQLFVHRDRHISHRPLTGTVNSSLLCFNEP